MNESNFSKERIAGFYEEHLKKVLLPFWLKKSVDTEYGGFFTCFDNTGTTLLSEDKFTWSQGRMVWVFSKLASMHCFSKDERSRYLGLAKNGAEFLIENCILDNGNCTFLMDRKGNPKHQEQAQVQNQASMQEYDTSIYADCFVVLGIARYAAEAGDQSSLLFAAKLFDSIAARIESGTYKSDPYPVPAGHKVHGIPMIMLCISQELAYAMSRLGHERAEEISRKADYYMNEIMQNFVAPDYALHEMVSLENKLMPDSLYGRYVNPGHTIEDMWFVIHQVKPGKNDDIIQKAVKVVKRAFEVGWDNEEGGLLLFADQDGGMPHGSIEGHENDEMVRKISQDWSSKLWWVHSEALYTTLLSYKITQDEHFLLLYEKVSDYTFKTFPNPDLSIGEWIQIRDRSGAPMQKTVALPVKDPFHIIRNVIQIFELMKEW